MVRWTIREQVQPLTRRTQFLYGETLLTSHRMTTLTNPSFRITWEFLSSLVSSASTSSVTWKTRFRCRRMLLTSFQMVTLTSPAILTSSATPSELVSSALAGQVTWRMRFSCICAPPPTTSAPPRCDFMHHRYGYHTLAVYAITLSFMLILSQSTSFLNMRRVASPSHTVILNSCKVLMWCGRRQLQLLNWGSQKLRSNGLSEDARPFWWSPSTFAALIKSCDLLIQIMPVDFGNYTALDHTGATHERSLFALSEKTKSARES